MSVEITQDNLRTIMRAIRKLKDTDVLVGIPESEEARKDGDPITNAMIGYNMEYGVPSKGVPARPTLIPGVASVKDLIAARFKLAGKYAIEGRPKEIEKQMNIAGMIAVTAVKTLINSNISPELSPRTIAAREARGVTRTNTLVDTGQFRNSITYVLRQKGNT